uniref:Uncharacterized protein n=1 Tax=Picea glauca TaxID=3330 RepID=A0A101LUU0_PICGL|nr:hypothetical protein ABT39_MTgene2325 [Picea glauca]QHR89304.1 hypothetical protein Q903MT_gene3325 [Picea sitchensis]
MFCLLIECGQGSYRISAIQSPSNSWKHLNLRSWAAEAAERNMLLSLHIARRGSVQLDIKDSPHRSDLEHHLCHFFISNKSIDRGR